MTMVDLRTDRDRRFEDPLRERDLATCGVEATVHVVAGPPERIIVEMSPSGFDNLTGSAEWHDECYPSELVDDVRREAHDHGYAEALADIAKLAEK